MPRIRFTTLFAERIGGATSVDVTGASIREALEQLTSRHPELRTLVWKTHSTLNPVMVLFLNDRQLDPADVDGPLAADDTLDIVPALEGGGAAPPSRIQAR